MVRDNFAALVARLGRDLTVYGPFASRVEARWGADWAGSTSTGVVITCPVALSRPESDPVSVVDGAWRAEVVRLPDAVAYVTTVDHADATGITSRKSVRQVVTTALRVAITDGPLRKHCTGHPDVRSVAAVNEWEPRRRRRPRAAGTAPSAAASLGVAAALPGESATRGPQRTIPGTWP